MLKFRLENEKLPMMLTVLDIASFMYTILRGICVKFSRPIFFQCISHYVFSRSINIKSERFEVEQVHRVIAFDYVKRVILVKYGKSKVALYGFRHIFQTVKIKCAVLCNKLYCNIAVCFDVGIW